MLMEIIQSWRPCKLPIILLVATLALFTGGCSDRESQDGHQTKSSESHSATMAEHEPMEAADEAEEDEMSADEMEDGKMSPGEAEEEKMSTDETEVADVAAGEFIYKNSCVACHGAGIAGAPKLGDKDAWAPRIAKGNDALLESVTKGFNAMPPKGGCMNCSDQDLRNAVAYLVSQGS